MNLKNKKIAVLGLGEDGLSLVKGLSEAGARVLACGTHDSQDHREGLRSSIPSELVTWIWEPVAVDAFLGLDGVVFSSGSGRYHEARDAARAKGIPVYSDLDFVTFVLKAPCIGITGTNGKSTTMALLHEMLTAGGFKVSMTGGDFDPWGARLNDARKYDFHLLELSSTRLENSERFHPKIALLLNIFPAHGSRHRGGLPAYLDAKAKIFANQTAEDFLIHEASAVNVRELIRRKQAKAQRVMFSLDEVVPAPGVFRRDNDLIWQGSGTSEETYPLAAVKNKSPAQLLNAMAALAAARLAGATPEAVRKALGEFSGLPHRMERVREVGGVTFVDDSRATNLGAAIWAVCSFNRPLWLILGGRLDSAANFEMLEQVTRKRVKTIFVYGHDKAAIAAHLQQGPRVIEVESLQEAVDIANRSAEEKDVVLFSPGCPPDIFVQGQGVERGEEFRRVVAGLKEVQRTVRPKIEFTRI